MSRLAGQRVLVTRPAIDAARLAAHIEHAGGEAVRFPALAVSAVLPPPAVPAHADGWIFISPNAARHGVALLHGAHAKAVFAVGPGTARALRESGIDTVITPDGQDSEALLALPALHDVDGKTLVIVRGVGGRPVLGDTLRARGATVVYAECYQRSCPATDPAPLIARWHADGIDAVTIASVETYANLLHLLGPAMTPTVCATPVFAPHAKIAAGVRTLGARHAVVTAGGDAGLVAGLIHWFRMPQ